MKINKKRIRNVKNYLSEFKTDDNIRVAVKVDSVNKDILNNLGFSSELAVGECILPDARLSKAAMENSEGRCIIRKDIPKEKYDRYWEWSWEDWGGNTHYDFTYITKERYVREYLTPEGVEITILKSQNGSKWLSTETIPVLEEMYDRIKLSVNLFLSLFGECHIVNNRFETPIRVTKSCDWEILKPGCIPSADIRKSIDRAIERNVTKSKKRFYKRGIDELIENSPKVVAVGTKGFNGYLVFEYPKQGIAILESLMPNNATYILGKNWEAISRLTKREILDNNLHIDRIFHYQTWSEQIKQYLSIDHKETA